MFASKLKTIYKQYNYKPIIKLTPLKPIIKKDIQIKEIKIKIDNKT